jgi:hypothetical protein
MSNLPLKYLRSSVLWSVVALLIAINLWLGIKAGGDNLLNNLTAPRGIISLETTGSVESARKIIQSWNKNTPGEIPLRSIALRSLIYDYIFIVFYTFTLALVCLIAAGVFNANHEKLNRLGLVKLGVGLARLQIVTAALDAIENIALWRMLRDSTLSIWPLLARWCALPKFGLIAVSFIYILLAFIFWIGESHKRKPLRKSQVSTP